jgi:S-DNA-T family DNA segregation ATPase FtsK/SpoIIIE
MDLVVRTPHGDAELTLDAWDPAATVAELVELTTGHTSPALLQIDDRPVAASTLLRDAPILIGSVVSSHPTPSVSLDPNSVRLLQLTGRGAGTVRSLEPGRYRIGPGRRRLAIELADAAVEQPLLELVVGDPSDQPSGGVTVLAIGPERATLDGVELDGPNGWGTEQLRIGQRLFVLDREPEQRSGRDRFHADPDGTIPFGRAPLLTDDDANANIVDSVDAAKTIGSALWGRRIEPNGALLIPFGFVDEEVVGQSLRPATLAMDSARPAAITGPPSFRDGLARTLLVEAATRYGPADLSLVIATRPDRLGEWDWAKWLPHARTGRSRAQRGITLFHRAADLRRWSTSISTNETLTLLVLDDADLWSRSDSPLRDLLAGRPANVVTLALADRMERAPASSASIIRHESDQRCRLIGTGRSISVVPSLVEPDVAAATARALAPLRDAELALDDGPSTGVSSSNTFVAAIEALANPDPPSPPVVVLGISESGDPVRVHWADGATWSVTGDDREDVATTALVVLLSLAITSEPTHTPIVVVGPHRSAIGDIVERLPHFAGRCDAGDTDASTRMLVRLTRHLEESGGAVVVVDESPHDAERTAEVVSFLSQLDHLARHQPRLRILDVSNGGASSTGGASLTSDFAITIDRRSSAPHAFAEAADGGVAQWFAPFDPIATRSKSAGPAASASRPSAGSMTARPFAFGRPLSPLERRLERSSAGAETFVLDDATNDLIDSIGRVGRDRTHDATPQLTPPALPMAVSLEALLVAYEADGVPIGLADDPAQDGHGVVWWQPGATGSILFIGTPRSGVDVALATLPLGIRERFGPSDLVVHSIDASNRRLGTLRQLPNTRRLAALDRLDRVAEIVDEVAREVSSRRSGPIPPGHPNVLLMIGDLTQLGRRLRDSSYAWVLDRLAVAASGAAVGVNVVATASRASDSCGLSDVIGRMFVGALSSAADAEALGFELAQLNDLGAGRCREFGTGRLVQLAAGATEVDGRLLDDAAGSPP